MKSNLKIIFVGTQSIGYDALGMMLRNKHNVVSVITSKPDSHEKWSNNVIDIAKSKKIPVYFDNEFTPSLVKKLKPDIIVVVGYRRIIKDEILKLPKFGVIGLHASLLPKFKGNAPLNYAILNFESVTGITLFQITNKVDEGDILGQAKTKIKKDEYITSLKKRVFDLGIKLLEEKLWQIVDETITYTKQEENNVFYCKRSPEDGLVDWTKNSHSIFALIRACEPSYPAYTFYKEKKIEILKAKINFSNDSYIGSVGQVGKILKSKDIVVITNNGHLIITQIKVDGKKFKPSQILKNSNIRFKNIQGEIPRNQKFM